MAIVGGTEFPRNTRFIDNEKQKIVMVRGWKPRCDNGTDVHLVETNGSQEYIVSLFDFISDRFKEVSCHGKE